MKLEDAVPAGAEHSWTIAKMMADKSISSHGPFTVRKLGRYWWVVDADDYYWARSISKAACEKAVDKLHMHAARRIMVQGTEAENQ